MSFFRDLKIAIRSLSRVPSLWITVALTLALGIGANAAIFSVLDSVVLNALPYPDPPRPVFVWERFPGLPEPIGERMQVARKNYLEGSGRARLSPPSKPSVECPSRKPVGTTRFGSRPGSHPPASFRCWARRRASAVCSPPPKRFPAPIGSPC
jgi:hypothetical protein